ncbi:1-phosphatidylinositol 4,5-bisphosphate phosphodiesterase delta-3-A [Bagarius yarrelli]|uniref:phosphoinositide phospholipase C n=1 Tax=Bagarius yarrelli TaxID=175774 RepID=A0A556TIQ0_BAGYA|nr:1-phosphatidylinositol 4,5-bisphosphate phosphodiesterase delta-3-A [Bagarius yarrelli]
MLGNGDKAKAVHGNGAAKPEAEQPLRNLGVQDDGDVQAMLQGSTMLKLRSPRWQRKRILKLQDDGVTVHCESNGTFSKTKTFSVMEVECVREGCLSESLRKLAGSVQEGQCLTIVFKGGRKSLDLQCESIEEAQHWARGICTLQDRINNMSHTEKLDQYPLTVFNWPDQQIV